MPRTDYEGFQFWRIVNRAEQMRTMHPITRDILIRVAGDTVMDLREEFRREQRDVVAERIVASRLGAYE